MTVPDPSRQRTERADVGRVVFTPVAAADQDRYPLPIEVREPDALDSSQCPKASRIDTEGIG
jgi:hypothetical protein